MADRTDRKNESEAAAAALSYAREQAISACGEAPKGSVFVVVPEKEIPYCTFFAFDKGVPVFSCRGTVGRNGVARTRREGDGTTPAGVFSFGMCFGIQKAPEGMKLPYHVLEEQDYWDGDSDSPTYNQFVDGRKMPPSWNREASEHLISYRISYNYCAFIRYNTDPVRKGLGSAIFLHCVNAHFGGTAGCVGLPEPYMIRALTMLTGDSRIVICAS